ncbi:hypothetical protein E2C01_101321 [Portunus trituberculatus]|uniref:Uncharacterized protein n=1 Tax=Portunus trituberculatus TaxID=210409 RepID=A0A5B7K9A3_PORTR|nr:hypothetical protein [Portunus trituberculatus]
MSRLFYTQHPATRTTRCDTQTPLPHKPPILSRPPTSLPLTTRTHTHFDSETLLSAARQLSKGSG